MDRLATAGVRLDNFAFAAQANSRDIQRTPRERVTETRMPFVIAYTVSELKERKASAVCPCRINLNFFYFVLSSY